MDDTIKPKIPEWVKILNDIYEKIEKKEKDIKEYQKLRKLEKTDMNSLRDITRGIKDVLTGNIKEI